LAASLACSLAQVACADPCFDDGIAQGGCPEQESETDPSASSTEASADATRGDATAPDSTAETGVGTAGGSGLDCPQLEEVLLPQIPTFQLVVDQSGSMNEDFDAGVTRWEAVEDTLIGPDGVVTQLQSSIRFGISLYDNPMMGMCPDVLSLPPQLDAADEISALFAAEMPGGDTPTGESIEQITGELLGDPWEGEKVMVLATDGEPDTCAVPDPMGAEVDMVRGVAVDAVAAAYDAGIRTFVISVGLDIAEEHLQDLANAGVGVQAGDPAAEFYVANDTASLVAAFNAIVAGLRPCDFPLMSPLPAELAPSCDLTVNDAPFPFDDPDGWAVQDETTLELQGAACTAIQEGVVEVKLQCSCEP
jgi:von Willebrand factor type A domain